MVQVLGFHYDWGRISNWVSFVYSCISISLSASASWRKSRASPFSNYLTKKVFSDEERFTARSFNNYAKSYENIEKDLTDSKGVKSSTLRFS